MTTGTLEKSRQLYDKYIALAELNHTISLGIINGTYGTSSAPQEWLKGVQREMEQVEQEQRALGVNIPKSVTAKGDAAC